MTSRALSRSTPSAIGLWDVADDSPNHVPDLRGWNGFTAPCLRCERRVTAEQWAGEKCTGTETTDEGA